jgi:hypothetical protein
LTQTLLDKIIESGTANEPPPLTSVLRQCILLSDQLKVPLLRTWAERELTGYSNPKDVPEYRIVNVGAYGNFAGVGVRYQARPIPASLLKPEHRWAATKRRLTEPVSAYESLDGSSKSALIYDWPSDMIAYYQSRLLEGCVLMTAWQHVPKSVFAGVLDTIRTRVLTMAIDIKNDSERAGVDLTRIKQDSFSRPSFTTFMATCTLLPGIKSSTPRTSKSATGTICTKCSKTLESTKPIWVN